jgi:hypothetical protein
MSRAARDRHVHHHRHQRIHDTMKTFHQPSGLHHGLNLFIDANWTPAQAWAVIELLDDLRERLLAHYQLSLAGWLTEDRRMRPDGLDDNLGNTDF